MRHLRQILFPILLSGLLGMPFYALAFGLSFGGRVSTLPLPCLNGGLYVTVLSARGIDPLFPEPYIWTLGTITFLAGPPTHLGQKILGIADIPYVCVISSPPYSLPGLRMQIVGTSLI